MVGDYSYTTDAAVLACEDREQIWERCEKLGKKMPFSKALAVAQLEFVESVILEFLTQNNVIEEEKKEDAELPSDRGEEESGHQEAETEKVAV